MIEQEKLTLLKNNYLFNGLTDEQIRKVIEISQEIAIEKDAYLFHEGALGNDAYLLLSGKIGILKKEAESGELQLIATLEPGELVGEMPLIDNSPRSASVLALEPAQFLVLPLSMLQTLPGQESIYALIIQNISKQLTFRLRNTNETTVKALQAELQGAKVRVEMGRFLFRMLLVLSGWIFLSTIVTQYQSKLAYTSFISIPAIFLIFIVCVTQIKNSVYPLSYYGLTFKNWGKYALEGALFTLPFLVFATFLKYYLIKTIPALHNKPLIQIDFNDPAVYRTVIIPGLIYLFFTPFQEFVARSTAQTCIKASLLGTHRIFWSIALSNLIFASFHVFISPVYAIGAFVGGFFWGWLFARQGSIIGCSVSHMLVGGWFLIALNFHGLFRGIY